MDYNNELDRWPENRHNRPRERHMTSLLARSLTGEGGNVSKLNDDRPDCACWDLDAPGAANGFINKNACFIISLPWSKEAAI
jgi:hypothetical protein